jgi:dihydrofolate reductase
MIVTYYVASSLDGYIAKNNGDVSWLNDLDITMKDTGYDDFYSTVDALVMGRKTYDMIVSLGQWPYGDKPVWVCSSTKIEPMEGCNLQAGSTPDDTCHAAAKMNIKHLWFVGGGSLASSFLKNNLLTSISLSLMPILLGEGIKLFGSLPSPIKLNKEREVLHRSGMVQLEYKLNHTRHSS